MEKNGLPPSTSKSASDGDGSQPDFQDRNEVMKKAEEQADVFFASPVNKAKTRVVDQARKSDQDDAE